MLNNNIIADYRNETISLYNKDCLEVLERLPNNKLKIIDNLKRQIEDKSIYVNIVKTELDSSIFTINRQYIIRNFDTLGRNTGKFLLSRKREVYTLDNDNFILSCVLTFRKILS